MGNFLSNLTKSIDNLSEAIFSDDNVKSYEKTLKVNYKDNTSVSETHKYFRNASEHISRKISKNK